MPSSQSRKYKCNHQWTRWKGTGTGEKLEARGCRQCRRIQKRVKPAASNKTNSLKVQRGVADSLDGRFQKKKRSTPRINAERLRMGGDSINALARRELGIARASNREWNAVGIPHPERSAWSERGFDPHLAQCWRFSGFSAPEASSWSAARVTPEDAAMLRDQGVTRREAQEWKSAGFNPTQLVSWKVTEIPLAMARRWKNAGIEPDEAAERHRAGQTAPPDTSGASAQYPDWNYYK